MYAFYSGGGASFNYLFIYGIVFHFPFHLF